MRVHLAIAKLNDISIPNEESVAGVGHVGDVVEVGVVSGEVEVVEIGVEASSKANLLPVNWRSRSAGKQLKAFKEFNC